MTWTLILYDHNDVEIGYVEKPNKYAYNVVINHSDSGWDDIKSKLEQYELFFPDDPAVELQDRVSLGTIESGPYSYRFQPEDHLQQVQDAFSHPDVARIELNDK